jgi:basic membrane protein A
MKKRKMRLLLLLLVMGLLVACQREATEPTPAPDGGQAEAPDNASEGEADGESEEDGPVRIAHVTPNPLGINQFLSLGEQGLAQIEEDYNVETTTVESEGPTERAENVRAMVREGWDIILLLSFDFLDIVNEVAPQNPDTTFVMVDTCPEQEHENVYCASFREHEASFLLGAAAALMTETNVVGTVAAVDTPFVRRWPEGFAQGAKYINPDIETQSLFVGNFSDPAKAKELALSMAADGADHILAAAAAGSIGVHEAAGEAGFYSYGVDINECPNDPEHIMENLIKRVDVAVYETLSSILEGESDQHEFAYGLEENGVGLTVLTAEEPEETQCAILEHPEVIEQVSEIRQQIIDGEIEVIDPLTAGN